MSAAILFTLLVAAAGDPPSVRYASKAVTKSWEPLPVGEVEKLVEAKVLAGLTKPGVMRLEKSGWADLANGDYTLAVQSRFVEEAESFSVHLAFNHGKKDDVPSFHVAETRALGRLNRQQMQAKIEDAADKAGTRLAELIAPRLEALRLSVLPPSLDDPSLPVSWGPVEVPEVKNPSKAIRTLLDPRNPDHERHKALTEIQGHVFDQQVARNAVERCVLSDPLPALRARCADALEAVARNHVPTQRILLHALRNEVEPSVVTPLIKLSTNFVGLSRDESIATWLELVSSDATPGESADDAAQLLAEENNIPNLDIAVAKCLQQEALAYGKKSACAQWLLRKIPEERMWPVVEPYLRTVAVWEQGERNVFEDVIENATGRSNKPISAPLAALLMNLVEREATGNVRQNLLYHLRRHPAPTPELMERLLKVAREGDMAPQVFQTVLEWVETAPHLKQMTLGALGRLKESAKWLVKPSRQNPYKELDEVAQRLNRMK